jgi:hypothetical protein
MSNSDSEALKLLDTKLFIPMSDPILSMNQITQVLAPVNDR